MVCIGAPSLYRARARIGLSSGDQAMRRAKAAAAASVLAASAGMCGAAFGQQGVTRTSLEPYRLADGNWIYPRPGTCSKAHMAELFWHGQRQREDPYGDGIACDVSEDTDVLHCSLDLELFPSTSSISGSNTLTVMSKVDGLNTFTFRLRTQF